MVVVWCPDWPVVAAGAPPGGLTAVVHANRVVACSPAARAEGVHPGLRRREAQSRCPELELLAHDPARDARAFEPVLVALEQLTPWVEVLQPGECAFPSRGAARYHGGEPALIATVTAAVQAALGGRGGCRVGIADGTFTAALAARRPRVESALSQVGPAGRRGGGTPVAGLVSRHGVIVPPGGSRAFLAPLAVSALDRPDLADLLVRLGLRTLGDLAALPPADLATRFGPEGARAARLAAGLDEHPRGARRPPPDLRVAAELDPPADRVDMAAFTAKALADELVARLDRLGLACTRLRIEARTDQGETLSRTWRYDPVAPPSRSSSPDPVPRSAAPGGGPGGPPARMAAVMAERVRWQLDGWLTGRTGRPPGALAHLLLVPDEVVPDRGRQLGFWGEETEITQRAARALARIQGLLGPEAVHTPRLRGGRDPAARVTATPTPDPAPPSPGGRVKGEGAEGNGRTRAGTTGAGRTRAGGAGAGRTGAGRTGAEGAGAGGAGAEGASKGSASDGGASGSPRAISPSSISPPPDPRASAPPPWDSRASTPPQSGSRAAGPSDPDAAGGPVAGASGLPRRGWASAQVPDVPGLPRRTGPAGPLPLDPSGAGQGPATVPRAEPWPGQVPAPAPALVYAEPLPVEVVDAAGASVAVDGRGLLGSLPSRVRVRGRAWSAITAWAGPWLVDERWWDPAAHRRLVRLQATTDQGTAYLLRLAGGHWWVEAIYD
ncbi:MAG TPA: DNA polymerase Y family protein [Actinomycetota bacterium]|jgi:protein ImuB|nr:DNA polymerase Y family protein [Actinomycetota bacterium]